MINSTKYKFTSSIPKNVILIEFVSYNNFDLFLKKQNKLAQQWIDNYNFIADTHSHCIIFNNKGIQKKYSLG